MEVSWNRGTLHSSILIGFALINHPFWGTPNLGNPHTDVELQNGLDFGPYESIIDQNKGIWAILLKGSGKGGALHTQRQARVWNAEARYLHFSLLDSQIQATSNLPSSRNPSKNLRKKNGIMTSVCLFAPGQVLDQCGLPWFTTCFAIPAIPEFAKCSRTVSRDPQKMLKTLVQRSFIYSNYSSITTQQLFAKKKT